MLDGLLQGWEFLKGLTVTQLCLVAALCCFVAAAVLTKLQPYERTRWFYFGLGLLALWVVLIFVPVFLPPTSSTNSPVRPSEASSTSPSVTPSGIPSIASSQSPSASVFTENSFIKEYEQEKGKFPQAECGDQGYPTFPVLIDYSPDRLQKVKSQFCQDAFLSLSDNQIQVASFRSFQRARWFAELMEKYVARPKIGNPRQSG